MTKPTVTRRAPRRARESDLAKIAAIATEREMKPITQTDLGAVLGFMLTGDAHLLLEPDEQNGTRISLVDRGSHAANVYAFGVTAWLFGSAGFYVWLESAEPMLALSLLALTVTVPTAWVVSKQRKRACAELLDAIEAQLG